MTKQKEQEEKAKTTTREEIEKGNQMTDRRLTSDIPGLPSGYDKL